MRMLRFVFLFILGPLLMSCPRPTVPDFCARPDPITVRAGCYDTRKGLVLYSSVPPGSDQSTLLRWSVYIVADSLIGAPFNKAQIRDVASGDSLVVDNDLLAANQKVYVEIVSECTGYPQDKAPGLAAAAFIKRYSQSSGCDNWVQQPF